MPPRATGILNQARVLPSWGQVAGCAEFGHWMRCVIPCSFLIAPLGLQEQPRRSPGTSVGLGTNSHLICCHFTCFIWKEEILRRIFWPCKSNLPCSLPEEKEPRTKRKSRGREVGWHRKHQAEPENCSSLEAKHKAQQDPEEITETKGSGKRAAEV